MKNRIKIMSYIGILSAMSFVLFMFPKFQLIPAFPWLDMDFSDVPALIAAVNISPLAGVCVVAIKNLIHLTVTSTAAIGELSNLLICSSFVLAAGLAYKYVFKNAMGFWRTIASLAFGAVFQLAAAILVNYYIMIPMYSAFVNFAELGGAEKYILAGVIPFNAIKVLLVSIAFAVMYKLIYKQISRFLKK